MLLNHIRLFFKEKVSETSLPCLIFCIIFKEKYFSCYILFHSILFYSIFYSIPNFIVWLSLLHEILGNMCIAIVSWLGCDVINFKGNLIFLIKPFCPTWPKSHGKNLNISRTKTRWNKQHFSSLLKSFQWSK